MAEPTGQPKGGWLGFSRNALITHGVLAVVTLGFWLLVPAAIVARRRGGKPGRIISWGLWGVVGVIVLSVVITVASIGGSDSKEAADTNAAVSTEAAAPATTEAEPVIEEEPPPPAEPVDTGRMSDGEYGFFSTQLADIDTELQQYSAALPKCAVLMQALELADASDCINDAYSGLDGDMLGAYQTTKDTEKDVAKGCLRALRRYRNRLDVFYGWMTKTKDAGVNLQFDAFTELANLSTLMFGQYGKARDSVLRACEPI